MSGEEDPIISAGGFCAPLSAIYDASLMDKNEFTHLGFPDIKVSKDVRRWFEPPTDAERRAAEAVRSLVHRIAERCSAMRRMAIDKACLTAMYEGWDVHVYEPPQPVTLSSRTSSDELVPLAYVGIEFTERVHPVPTVHYHQSDRWDYDWEDD